MANDTVKSKVKKTEEESFQYSTIPNGHAMPL